MSEGIRLERPACQPIERVRLAPLLVRVEERERPLVVKPVAEKGLTAEVVLELPLGLVESAVHRGRPLLLDSCVIGMEIWRNFVHIASITALGDLDLAVEVSLAVIAAHVVLALVVDSMDVEMRDSFGVKPRELLPPSPLVATQFS